MSKHTSKSFNLNYLDRYRLNNGVNKLKTYFKDMFYKNKDEALSLLNSTNLQYPSLYALRGEIKKLDIFNALSSRNKSALDVTDKISNNSLDLINNKENHNTLSWIINTGYLADGISPHYDELLDKTAILLLKVHKDNDCLSAVENLIYNRHRKGSYIYDLVWAFLESKSPQCINMTLKRLLSSNSQDVLLSRKLLGFIPSMNKEENHDRYMLYTKASRWIRENYNFIYYQGEHFHQTPTPSIFRLSLENKYLQNTTHLGSIENKRTYTDTEISIIDSFRKLESGYQKLLSDYSNYLYKQSRKKWNKWIGKSIYEQLEIAKSSRFKGSLSIDNNM
ncbi:MAG TPA: hypothetical protein VIO64_12055 [Pseudobacteroides sp.]|uniref:hypothetical protein n=1 Tax=Pseudobacteroides sp. TaxID=1968840 RepID=UPI002F944636